MPPTVVFDTNVLLSGVGWKGKPFQCLELARIGSIRGITCPELLEELSEKLRTRLGFTDEQATDTLADLLSFLRVVTISNVLTVVAADPDDDKVIECAVVGGATHIVTGDRRHLLPLREFQGIRIVDASEFLQLMAESPQANEPL
jgi:putative PIN family toxin of toxin-antitoxin system